MFDTTRPADPDCGCSVSENRIDLSGDPAAWTWVAWCGVRGFDSDLSPPNLHAVIANMNPQDSDNRP